MKWDLAMKEFVTAGATCSGRTWAMQPTNGLLVQLGRALVSKTRGCRFNSCAARSTSSRSSVVV